jgi:hypothetical protein
MVVNGRTKGGKRAGKTAGRRKRVEAVEANVQPHAHLSVHQRTWRTLLKCGARTRSGRPCLGLIVRGKTRCRMHGGARGSGAQPGNRNRWRHGQFSRDNVEGRALMRLSSALNALVDAALAVIVAVARGDHDQFDRLVAAVAPKRDAVLAASASYQRFLRRIGRGAEAEALAADLAAVIVRPRWEDHAPAGRQEAAALG